MSMIPNQDFSDMQRLIDECSVHIDELIKGYCSPEKSNLLLDRAMSRLETACIEMRRLCERVRPTLPKRTISSKHFHSEEIYGEITLIEYGWVHIRLNALLPNCKTQGGTQYVTDSIVRLTDRFLQEGGYLPYFDRAFIGIVEHCDERNCDVFDQDNKGFKAIQNALKGRLFSDDDQFHLSLGLFSKLDADAACNIYIMPESEAGDFMYFLTGDGC